MPGHTQRKEREGGKALRQTQLEALEVGVMQLGTRSFPASCKRSPAQHLFLGMGTPEKKSLKGHLRLNMRGKAMEI